MKDKTRHITSIEELGKVPPQAIDMEEAVIGALLIESNSIHTVARLLKEETFYKDGHATIFKAILELYQSSQPIDLLTVTEQLKKNKELELVGGAYFITDLTTKINSGAHIEAHCKIIQEKWLKREAIAIASKVHQEAYEDSTDPFSLLDETMNSLIKTVEVVTKGKAQSYPDLLDQSMELIIERSQSDTKLPGIPTGFAALDKATGGLMEPDLIIIAARPGMGKTALAVQVAEYAANAGYPTGIFSLEMSALQLTQRTQSTKAEISLPNVIRGNLIDAEITRLQFITSKLKKAQLIIDDTAGINLIELKAKCHMMKHKHDIKLIVIDYLQLMDYMTTNRDEGIGKISKGIKAIAKELNIPIILLSQLSRAVELRAGPKRPQLSDLRESGSIEQDADAVWFLYRPEYYGKVQDDEGNDLRGKTELIIAKHRNGALETVNLRFLGKFVKFKDTIENAPEQKDTIPFQGEEKLPPF